MTPQQPTAPRGRPRSSSRDVLEEAAFELFLENGYAGTTIDQIATRAGVSRATFFNYFDAKSDVFWVQIDESLAKLPGYLAQTESRMPTLRAIGEALADVAADFGPDNVPWILTQHELVGSLDEIRSSAITRLTRHSAVLRDFAAARMRMSPAELLPRVIANTVIGAATAAAQTWAEAGPHRGALEPYLLRSLAPLADGFPLS